MSKNLHIANDTNMLLHVSVDTSPPQPIEPGKSNLFFSASTPIIEFSAKAEPDHVWAGHVEEDEESTFFIRLSCPDSQCQSQAIIPPGAILLTVECEAHQGTE